MGWDRTRRVGAVGLWALSASFGGAIAQNDEEGLPTVDAMMEDFTSSEGLFDFYTDPETGALYMAITDDQLGEEFIAFTYAENGVLEAGVFRGAYGSQRIIRFDKHYGNLELTEVNTSFYFDEENAISRAANANISDATLTSLDILAETPSSGDEGEAARYLISADDLFLGETLELVRPAPSARSSSWSFEVGELSPATKVSGLRTYPENVDVVIDYVFNNPFPFNPGSEAVTDARAVTLTLQHSFVAMPDEGFTPRLDDYRVGYFTSRVTDLTTKAAAPYRDLVNRWRLIKKDPEAEVSDPVEPITFWIENTTPLEFRDSVKEGVLAWNEAFEAAGISNALAVQVQPDDAAWDAGDIRYNVLRWTSSPTPPFGGYGPSFTNPRTGEIIGADIMLELAYVQNRLLYNETFESAGIISEDHADDGHGGAHHACRAGLEMRQGLSLGLAALETQGAGQGEKDELMRQALMSLIMHEVGHTLGLNHNMKGSAMHGPRDVHDASITQGRPTASVMDYAPVNLAPLGMEQGDYDHTRPGFYDLWAIQFGYDPDLDDQEARDALLARSREPALLFGNDADDMRWAGKGIDPRAMTWDMSSDPVAYAIDRLALTRHITDDLLESYSGEDSYQALYNRFVLASGQHARMAAVIARQIGGVYVERGDPDQMTDRAPFTPVPLKTQKAAMEALATHVFAADAFAIPQDLLQHLQVQRRGYDFWGTTEDPKPHSRALAVQGDVLRHLLHPTVLKRMTSTELYGNGYSVPAMLMDLNDGIFGNDLLGQPNAYRRNLQVFYARRLVDLAYGWGHDPVTQGAALAAISDIRMRFGFVPDFVLPLKTRAHRKALRLELGWVD